ncbi:MAG: hypothetical protein N3E49_00410 [Bacteroidia bacterium]|nr:hypothetical protein [Bacteroidia bacterium]
MVTLSPLQEGLGFVLVGFWLGYIGYRIEYHRAPFWLYFVLIVKVLAGWGVGWLYANYYCHGDILKAYLTAGRLAYYLGTAPADGLALLFREFSSSWEARGWEIFFRDIRLYGYDYEWSEPSNYFFYRLLVPLYLAAGGGYYGLQGLMALAGGLLGYAAYRRWQRVGALPERFWIVWFLMPSALVWTSGALRDTLAIPLLLYGTAWVASVHSIKDMGGAAALLLLAFLRPEALPIAVVMGALYRWNSRWLLLLVVGVSIVLLGKVIGPWCYTYRTEALDPRIHPEVVEGSVFQLAYEPSFWGSLMGWLKAIPYGLLGPFPGQVKKILPLFYMVEVWVLAGLGVYWAARAQWTLRAILLILGGTFIVGVIAMAVPFWGTLARQRLYGLYFIAIGVGLAVQPTFQKGQHRSSES